jgi:hypothetical protein
VEQLDNVNQHQETCTGHHPPEPSHADIINHGLHRFSGLKRQCYVAPAVTFWIATW